MENNSPVRLINATPIEKFIVDGLNNKDPRENFGFDGIRILTEIHFADEVKLEDIRPEASWLRISHELCENGHMYDDYFMCSRCLSRDDKHDPDYESFRSRFCPNCGAYMINNEYVNPDFDQPV